MLASVCQSYTQESFLHLTVGPDGVPCPEGPALPLPQSGQRPAHSICAYTPSAVQSSWNAVENTI